VLAALASSHYREALSSIQDLAALSARHHRDRMWRMLEPRLRAVPPQILEESLPRLSGNSLQSSSVRPAERTAAVDWMRHQILDVLSRSALEGRNVELAQRLVASAG